MPNEQFLQHGRNMKRIPVRASNISETESQISMHFERNEEPLIGVDGSWILREYPQLQYFGLSGILHLHGHNCQMVEFIFQAKSEHSKIRNGNRTGAASLGLKLDDFTIMGHGFESDMYYRMYEALLDQTFLKGCCCTVSPICHFIIRKFDSLEGIGALEKLHSLFTIFIDFHSLKRMTNLT